MQFEADFEVESQCVKVCYIKCSLKDIQAISDKQIYLGDPKLSW